MRYLLNDSAGDSQLELIDDDFRYIIKARRHVVGDEIVIRDRANLETLYRYQIGEIRKNSTTLELIDSKLDACNVSKKLHIAWCVIEPKSIEKVLPSLCEIGVDKISFIYCDRSQKNYKIDLDRFDRVLESSMMQCGRTSYIEFDIYDNIESFLEKYNDVLILDFSDEMLDKTDESKRVLIGCEGGFSTRERELFRGFKVARLNSPMVLKSESVVVAIASKLLL